MADVKGKLNSTGQIVTLIESTDQGNRRGHLVLTEKGIEWAPSGTIEILTINGMRV